ncbi:MAG: acetyl-CoA carboxylase carboxyltransferase subunit alpha [Acidobacteria bacterium]|nr:acetyl-CoA carboxylase carboxyltransferase subunit alpha [Acidobacteriota bacterium]
MAAKVQKQEAVALLEKQIAELEKSAPSTACLEEIQRLRQQIEALREEFSRGQDAWARVLLARHPQRPFTLDYIDLLFDDFQELHGDRTFADDHALIGGMAHFEKQPVMVIGIQKGRDTKQKVYRNFGMSRPEGYRKALRLMQLAAKFRRPIITLVDTPGAYPGIGAEERGQAEAIAHNLKEISKLPVPMVVLIHAEGGSGGALAIAVGDRVFMLENAIYSVISPESCSSILWHDWEHKREAAQILKLTAQELMALGLIHGLIPEPPGGAHTDYRKTAELIRPRLSSALKELSALSEEQLLRERFKNLRAPGRFVQESG